MEIIEQGGLAEYCDVCIGTEVNSRIASTNVKIRLFNEFEFWVSLCTLHLAELKGYIIEEKKAK